MVAPRGKKVRLKDRRRKESYLSVAIVAVLGLALIGGVAYAVRLPQVTVSEVQVEGTVFADSGAIEQAVHDTIDGSYLLLVPKRMTYVVPKGAVTASVIASFPIVQGVDVERTDKTLHVRVYEREPKALWCAESCYSMDQYGYIFDVGRGSDLRVYRGLVETPIGSTFLDGGFQDFNGLMDRIETATGRRVVQIVVDALDVFVTFEGGGELRFSRNAESEKLIGDITSIFTASSFGPERAFKYVELRFGSKAVVQFAD